MNHLSQISSARLGQTGSERNNYQGAISRGRRFRLSFAPTNSTSNGVRKSIIGLESTKPSGLLTECLRQISSTTAPSQREATTTIAVTVFHQEPVTSRTAPVPTSQRLPGLISAGRDRRAFPRRESGCQVAVCIQSSDNNLTSQQVDWQLHAGRMVGRLVDVSMNGLAFQLDRALDAETKVYLRISNRHLQQTLDTSGAVVRSKPTDDGQWTIVCRLEKNLTFEQIHTIGKQLFASTIV